MKNKTREKIEEFVKSKRWTPEDFYWKHAFQVRDYALKIQDRVGGNKDIVEVAALLHDVGKARFLGPRHEKISAEMSKKFLKKTNFEENKIKRIVEVIKYENFNLVETKIIRSADSMSLIIYKGGREWYFENILDNDSGKILEELKKSYSEIKYDFARDFVEDTYRELIGNYS